jgi:hypothetical protein
MRKITRRSHFCKNRRVDCEIHMKVNSSVNRNPDSSAQRARNEEQAFLTRIIYLEFYINDIIIIIIIMKYSNSSSSCRCKKRL